MTLLPSKPPVETDEADPQVVDFTEETEVFAALRSETARAILTELYEDPAVASELADRIDTSLQNVDHHLTNLCESGLVEVVDTWYSSKGREMKVYAPSNEALTLVIGGNESTDAFRQAVDELEDTVSS